MDIRTETLQGIGWSAVEQWGSQLIHLAVFVVLVRLLPPSAFGLIALATVFTALVEVLVDQGVAEAIVQRDELHDLHLASGFWMNLGVSAVLGTTTFLLADLISVILDEPDIAPVIQWLSLVFPISAFTGVQQALMRRHLRFRLLSTISLLSYLLAGMVGVSMALLGYGVWALVAQEITRRGIGAAAFWIHSDWTPSLRFSVSHFTDIFSFGINAAGTRLVGFFNTRADDFLIGYFLGSTALGFYTVGYRSIRLLTGMLTGMISRVTFPIFSRIQQDKTRVRHLFEKATQFTSLASFPMYIGLASVTPEVVHVFFGSKWSASIPVMQILCFIGVLHSLLYFNADIIMALGRPGWRFAINSVNAVANVIAFLIAVQWGITAVALAFVLRGYILSPLSYLAVGKLIPLNWRGYFHSIRAPLLGTGIMAIGLVLLRQWHYFGESSHLLKLILLVTIGALIYTTTVTMVRPELIGTIPRQIRTIVGRDQT